MDVPFNRCNMKKQIDNGNDSLALDMLKEKGF